MAGSAAGRPRASEEDGSPSDWTDGLRRLWRRVFVLVAHWRLRVRRRWGGVTGSVRRGCRHYLGRSLPGSRERGADATGNTLLPAVADSRALAVQPQRSEATDDGADASRTRSLPSSREARRGLPGGGGPLEVERTADRLTLSDPATEEAYLSSTVWIEVEE